MTIRHSWVAGSVGPFFYDDADPVLDPDLDYDGAAAPNQAALVTSGQLNVALAPVLDPEVLRLVDVGAIVGDVIGPAASTDEAIARFDGASGKLLQNSTVFITDAGNVGIGTASPNFLLDLYSSAGTNQRIQAGTLTDNAGIYLEDSGRNGWVVFNMGSVDKFFIGEQTAGVWQANRLSIIPGGNVGIGTENPALRLSVYDSINGSTEIRLANGTDGTSSRSQIAAQIGSGTQLFALIATGANYTDIAGYERSGFLYSEAGLSNGIVLNTAAGPIRFATAGVGGAFERVRIAANGKVGIGTTNPLSLLHLGFATEDLEFVNAGSAGATEQDWIEVEIGGVQGYLRVFAAV